LYVGLRLAGLPGRRYKPLRFFRKQPD